MKNRLAPGNYRNDLILIDSTIIFQLILGLCQRKYPPLMSLMMNRQFLLVGNFIFIVTILVPQRSALFTT